MVKGRAYDTAHPGHQSALYTLHKCFSTILLLLAPITPFATEELWDKIYADGKSIHLHDYLSSIKSGSQQTGQSETTKAITDFNSLVWNKKKETISKETGKPLSLKDSIDIEVPEKLAPFRPDLEAMHNIKRPQ
jgi:valyl-tRNA synthetase